MVSEGQWLVVSVLHACDEDQDANVQTSEAWTVVLLKSIVGEEGILGGTRKIIGFKNKEVNGEAT